MELRLFNTLTRRKEPFRPIRPGCAGIYTCGPTVYADAHIGNLRSYIFPDVLKKTLGRLGYRVTHVINITDVGHLTSNEDTGEDKMERAARSEGRSAWVIAAEHAEHFLADLERLNIELPDVMPRAAGPIPEAVRDAVERVSPRYAGLPGHIADQVALIQRLEAKGATYRTRDGIYFDTSRFPEYGRLARLQVEGLQEGARVDMGGKRNKTDFALWKFSPSDARRQMEWESPWGRGFPGWHIECSAMAMKYLGESFDIHTGGSDHIPVHHTNEIAQSEMATGQPFARYWLHGEFLLLGEDQRMGKSEGNLITLQDLIDRGFEPMACRYLVLNTHYRKFLNFSWEAMEAAATALIGLRQSVFSTWPERKRERNEESGDEGRRLIEEAMAANLPRTDAERQLLEALCDDLNTPKALGILWEELRRDSISPVEKRRLAAFADGILSLDIFAPPVVTGIIRATLPEVSAEARGLAHPHVVGVVHPPGVKDFAAPPEILARALERWRARQRRDFAQSDRLRDELAAQGWEVRDRKDGYDLVPTRA
jgi:cysteinyl-tRNA synthetase